MKTKNAKLVTKPELSLKVATETGITFPQAEFIVEAFCDIVSDYIMEGREVLLLKLGKFTFRDRNFRAVSHLNGKPIVPHKQLVFNVNKKLARDVRVGTRVK